VRGPLPHPACPYIPGAYRSAQIAQRIKCGRRFAMGERGRQTLTVSNRRAYAQHKRANLGTWVEPLAKAN